MMMINRTNSDDQDFHLLIQRLDDDLLKRYGELQVFYNRYNKIENLPTVVVAYINGKPAGCGCFKNFDAASVEVKRMYVADEYRGKGIATAILNELENWAAESGFQAIVLELGNKQPEAKKLYQKQSYSIIPNYGPYIDKEDTSICMKKALN